MGSLTSNILPREQHAVVSAACAILFDGYAVTRGRPRFDTDCNTWRLSIPLLDGDGMMSTRRVDEDEIVSASTGCDYRIAPNQPKQLTSCIYRCS